MTLITVVVLSQLGYSYEFETIHIALSDSLACCVNNCNVILLQVCNKVLSLELLLTNHTTWRIYYGYISAITVALLFSAVVGIYREKIDLLRGNLVIFMECVINAKLHLGSYIYQFSKLFMPIN